MSIQPLRNIATPTVFIYFGKATDGRFTDMRFVMQFLAEDWLFIHKAWAKADGVTTEPQLAGVAKVQLLHTAQGFMACASSGYGVAESL
ncbi:MAG TPA: hypothetical protein VLA64_07660 [Azonexus sp.]|nr:hypothetical protein [Azonexus sp.]